MKVIVLTLLIAFFIISCDSYDYLSHCGNSYSENETTPDINASPGTAEDNNITLSPGCQVEIKGQMLSTDSRDYFLLNTGTANVISFTIVWDSSENIQLQLRDEGDTAILKSTGSGTNKRDNLIWKVDSQNIKRYITTYIFGNSSTSNYTLTIEGF